MAEKARKTQQKQQPAGRPGEEPFRDALERGGVFLWDGAMGTMLYSKGVFIHRAFEELNLTQPALVREVHDAYRSAGAQILGTNTYAANRFRLSPKGLAEKVEEINIRGVEIAKEAAAGRAWVAGAIGPLGVRIEPFGAIGRGEAREVFAQQVRALVSAGVDLVALETFHHLPELEEALHAVRGVTDLPVVAQVSVEAGGETREGVRPDEVAHRLEEAGADAVGVNCAEALASLEALGRMRTATRLPLSGQPNAGQPRSVEGRNLYLASPEYLEAWGRRALRMGLRLLGGCCGTTPYHIRRLRRIVSEPTPEIPHTSIALTEDKFGTVEIIPRGEKSNLARSLSENRFVRGVEIAPPRGWVLRNEIEKARQLAKEGVDFLGLPEGRPDGAQVSPITMASQLGDAGIETLVTYSCRGRRLVRIQSDLLGAFATGATNLLVVTGDPIFSGTDPDRPPELEVDSIGVVNLVTRLNHGQDVGDNPFGKSTAFHIGVRLDPTSYDLDREISRHHWKVDAGAEFAVTSPIFEPAALKSFVEHPEFESLPIIATVWPLESALQAEFFEREMAAVSVPALMVRRMQEAEKKGTELEEGVAIARELAREIQPLVQGILVVAVGGRIDSALKVLEVTR